MVLVLNESKAIDECITLGYSREPPVATFFGRMQCINEYREVVWYMPKRLPSRRWEQTSLVDLPNLREQLARRSLPEFQTTGRSREDDDDYEDAGLYSSELGGVSRKAEPTAIATKAMTLSILIKSAFARDEIFGWSKRWPTTSAQGAIQSRTAVSQGS
jgi:hypothetical protein